MKADLSDLAGRPETVSAGGETHAVSPLTVDDLADAQAWVNAQFPDPFDVVYSQIERASELGRPMPVSIQKHLLDRATEIASRGKPLIGTPEADAKLASQEGSIHLLYLAVRKNEPDFTEADARRFQAKLSAPARARVRRKSGIDLAAGDPKAPTPGGPAAREI